MRPSPGPSWTVLPGNVPQPRSSASITHLMQEPPSTSPSPTTQSDVDLGDDDENVTLNAPSAKRKAGQSPASLPRPPKVARFNDNIQTERHASPPSGERTNISAGYLTQAPNIAKKSHPSFSSQPVAPLSRHGKGKNRASSRQSTSSLSDHISNIVEKHNVRFRRLETARKTVRKRRVTTSGLIRDAQRSSGGSEISSAATRVRRASGRALPLVRSFFDADVIELTDSSDSNRRSRVGNDKRIIVLSSDTDTPPRLPRSSQKSKTCTAGSQRMPLPEADVLCLTDSDDDIIPPPATAIPAPPRVTRVPVLPPVAAIPSFHEPRIQSPPSNLEAIESIDNDELLDSDPPEYWYLDNDQATSSNSQDDSSMTQNLLLPAPDLLVNTTLPVSKHAAKTSSNVDSQLDGLKHPHSELLTDSQSTPYSPSQSGSNTALTTNKHSVTWKYTPSSTNPFFARTLSLNAKALNRPLPLSQTLAEPSPPDTMVTSPAAVESSTDISHGSLVDEQPSSALRGSSSTVLSYPPATSSSANDNRDMLTSIIDNAIDPLSAGINLTASDAQAPQATAPSSSLPVPVPPRVQRTTTNHALTELIEQTRKKHIKSRFVDLTCEAPSSSSDSVSPKVLTLKPHQPVQPIQPLLTDTAGSASASQPAPSVETRTPNIREIRDLMRLRQSSGNLSASSAATDPSTSSTTTDPSTSSVPVGPSSSSGASNPSSSSIVSATSPIRSSHSPPHSSTSNAFTPVGSKPHSHRKNRSKGVASLEMYISPTPGLSQTRSSQKTRTPRSGKKVSCGADRFKSIITPTADTTVRSQSLSPSEGRRHRHAGSHHLPTSVHTNDASAQNLTSPGTPPERPVAAPTDHETAAQQVGVEVRLAAESIPTKDITLLQSEGIQGVTDSIGSLDLRKDSRSPKGDIDVDQIRRLSLENICEDMLRAVPVSAKLMDHEETVDTVRAENVMEAPVSRGKYRNIEEEDGDVDMNPMPSSAQHTSGISDMLVESSDQEECLAVLEQLQVQDGEVGDAEHPISISSSRAESLYASSIETPESLQPTKSLTAVPPGGQVLATAIQQLEIGVESYIGGYPVVTWKSHSDARRRLPPNYKLAKDLPHELQDRVNALPESYRNSKQARLLFESVIDEATDDLNAPRISIINDITDEGAPPWEFVYTNQMWYGEGVPPPDVRNLKSCGCVGRCDPKSKTCSCAKKQYRHLKEYIEDSTIPKSWNGAPFVYDSKGCLQWFGLPIFECNAFCGCDDDCPNRVVQNGRKYVVNIKRTEKKGWGVFNGQKKIPKGSFIGVYAGELIAVSEADHRGTLYNKFGRTYLFDIDFHHIGSIAIYSVDAYHAGNFTRFLNHSCDPNCEIQACYINDANLSKPMLTVFTVREVEPFEELSFSYMGQIDDDSFTRPKVSNDAVFATCHCGSTNCVGSLFSG